MLRGTFRQPVNLLDAAVSQSTRLKYRQAVFHFLTWCRSNNEDANIQDAEVIDALLCEYIQYLYDNHGAHWRGICALYGLIHFLPRFRHRLCTSQRALQGWARLEPPISHPPLTWELTVAISIQMARRGLWRQAVATILAFRGMLRVGELVSIKREDIAFAGDRRMGFAFSKTVIRLAHTKTGNNKDVEINHHALIVLLRELVRSTPSSSFIFPFTSAAYRQLFHSVCHELGLSSEYVPHSLRHGGATYYHFVKHIDINEIMLRGRWQSSKSARLYIQTGRALLMLQRVPADVSRFGHLMCRHLVKNLSLAKQWH